MEEKEFVEPVNLNFCYGINECSGSVHVIKSENEKRETNDHERNEIGNVSVIYSVDNNLALLNGKKQNIFRGHLNKISKVVKSRNMEFIASCDKGPNSFILFWKINNDYLEPIKKLNCSTLSNISLEKKNQKKTSYNANMGYIGNVANFNRESSNDVEQNSKNDIYCNDTETDNNSSSISEKETEKKNKMTIDKEHLRTREREQEITTEKISTRQNREDIIGFESIDISYDNRYICALTEAQEYLKTEEMHNKLHNPCFQKVLIFDLNEVENCIICAEKIFGKEKQTKIRFSKNYEIVSNSKRKLHIYHFDKKKIINHYSPSLYKNNKTNGNFIFTETCFVENSTQIITGTENGFLIIWDYSSIFLNKNKSNIKHREYQKSLEIRNNASINILFSLGNYIILGLQDGSVQVLTKDLKCYAWFENEKLGAIKSISFEYSDFQKNFLEWNSFIVFSENNIVKRIFPNSFKAYYLKDEKNEQKNIYADANTHYSSEVLLNFHCSSISCISMSLMREDNIVFIGNINGIIEVFDFDNNEIIAVFNLKHKEIVKMTFNKKGNLLCVGCKCGHIFLINVESMLTLKNKRGENTYDSSLKSVPKKAIKLGNGIEEKIIDSEILFSSRDMKHEIKFICFSEDDKIVVCCSPNGNLIIYKNEEKNNVVNWKYAHKIVNDNNFLFNDLTIIKDLTNYYVYTIVAITSNKYIIFHFFDLKHNTVSISYSKNEQTSISTCLTGNLYFYNQYILCICNDQSKLRFFDVENKQIIKTVHLPFQNGKIKKIIPLIKEEEKKEMKDMPQMRKKCFRKFLNTNESNTIGELNIIENNMSSKENKIDSTSYGKNDFTPQNIFVFVLNEKMVVFTMSPLSANCFRYIGAIICNGTIEEIISKQNHMFVLSDNHILYFTVNREMIKNYIKIQNNTLETFINQIGGENSTLYKKIVDSFYYCEIQKKRNENIKEKHNIKKLLSLLSIEYIFASINVFLSTFEIQNIMQEYYFYYKYARNILIQQKVPISRKIQLGEQTLVSYQCDDDLLLQNIFFLQQKLKDKDEKNKSSKKTEEYHKNLKKKEKEKKKKDEKQRENKKNGQDADIMEEYKNIYFNINAFIYTYFNFPVKENIDIKETILEIMEYYKNKNKKTNLTFQDLLYILKNFGESMEEEEFKRIFQIFSKNNLFHLEDKMELHQLKDLFQ